MPTPMVFPGEDGNAVTWSRDMRRAAASTADRDKESTGADGSEVDCAAKKKSAKRSKTRLFSVCGL